MCLLVAPLLPCQSSLCLHPGSGLFLGDVTASASLVFLLLLLLIKLKESLLKGSFGSLEKEVVDSTHRRFLFLGSH